MPSTNYAYPKNFHLPLILLINHALLKRLNVRYAPSSLSSKLLDMQAFIILGLKYPVTSKKIINCEILAQVLGLRQWRVILTVF